MADTLQFTFTAYEMEKYLAWRAEVEAETGQPLTGLSISFVLTTHGVRQIIVRPSTDADLKLHNIPREDGTLDTFVPHERVLAECDTFVERGHGKPPDALLGKRLSGLHSAMPVRIGLDDRHDLTAG